MASSTARWASAAVLFGLSACGGNSGLGPYNATSISLSCQQQQLDAIGQEALSDDERAALVYVREEEKLARDVYRHLWASWGLPIFDNIADSEQTHTDTVALLLERYGIEDPATDQAAGSFTNQDLQSLYDQLVAQGDASLIDALIVGATIEDLDIFDLQTQLDTVVDNLDIETVWSNLQKGSRNHLRSFVDQLDGRGVSYSPQYLDQDTYEAIVTSPRETGRCLF